MPRRPPAYTPIRLPASPWKARLWALFFMGLSGALGYHAWQLHEQHGASREALNDSRLQAAQHSVERSKLAKCLSEKESQAIECASSEQMLGHLQANLNATKAEIETLRTQKREAAKHLASFKQVTQKLRKMIDAGKLDVVIRDGRMVVKLPAGVLFDSGRAELSRQGELALIEVAVALRQFEDRKFMVEGHTDDRPLENAGEDSRYQDNWELSAGRAINVVKFLIEAKMKPENLLAAGHGEYAPVANNRTPPGRQENRRIEIVLLPNVQELPSLPEDKPGA